MNESSNSIICPNCEASNRPENEVCWRCGQPLTQHTSRTPPQDDFRMRPLPDAEPPVYGNTVLFIVLGFLFAVLALFCCPLFGAIGVYLGLILRSRGNVFGTVIIVLSILFFAVGATVWIFVTIMQLPNLWNP